jgi:protein TonB
LIGWIYKTRIEPAATLVDEAPPAVVTLDRTRPDKPKPPPPRPVPHERRIEPRHVDTGPLKGPASQLVETPKSDPVADTVKTVEERTPDPPKSHVITRPTWEKVPDGAAFANAYPDRAQRLGKAGRVRLECQVAAAGTLSACKVASETPSDYGFGEASLKISRFFRMKPQLEDGQTVAGALVSIDILWRLPEE